MELDEEERQAIDTMAEFVARNGPTFEAMTRAKQRHNTKLAFLYQGHKHHGYYRAKVAELKMAEAAALKTHKAAGSAEATKIAHFKAQLLKRVMDTGTKAHIKEATFWSIEQRFSTKGFFELVLALQQRALSAEEPEKRIRCLLLAANMLYHGTRLRVHDLVSPLQTAMPALCFSVISTGDDGKHVVDQLLRVWAGDAVFPAPLMSSLESTCAGRVPPRPLLSDLPPARDEDAPLYATTPAALMMNAMRENNDFEPIDVEQLQPLPYDRPSSQHIQDALQEFFAPSKGKRTADGWERGALDQHYKRAPSWMQEQQHQHEPFGRGNGDYD
ncbi:hypothetical protein PTSG_12832 [Salpingoeca rosetta]|uniref:SURP motif domain-containing protein n=1 Tax=Salpingoeca rosetta (strain ATCC 50818 / BSB-021) TaxID=946362 RepID=F2UM52_SALR5|nr:uncharacterized protein PTSG_12832 [Salpingoeca rosetta]EGD78201.1 hypothetical protein PTSG_12832 [Salpingoeca rosetta]|eukprot:XP_004989877.1 hypothetical protein PTSG_12832 [Salpingoeca rosetta]